MKAAVIHEFGRPADVVQIEERDRPPLQPGEARVRLRFAPINPADLNMIEGTYGTRPNLPAVMGNEGVGEVLELAPGTPTPAPAPSSLVLLPPAAGTWCEEAVVAAQQLVVVPPGIAPEQAAMLRVNPATAWRMLHDFVTLAPGEFFLCNAANSGVGRALLQIGQARGWQPIALVRRAGLEDELRAEGATHVLLDDADAVEQIRALTGENGLRLALNAVGGESALRMAQALSPGGVHVTYGAMARQPLRLPASLLIFQDIALRGFWVTRWFKEATPAQREEMYTALFTMLRESRLRQPIAATYLLAEITNALRHATQDARAGKILLTFPE